MRKPRVALGACAAVAVAGALGAFLVLSAGGDKSAEDSVVRELATPSPTPRPAAATQPLPTSAPQATAVALPDRTTCAEIRGTPYRSDAERAFFLANCIQAQPQAGGGVTTSIDTSASCTTDIRVTTSRKDETYAVTGLTLSEINASLEANGPVANGEKSVGLAAYTYGLDGSFCTRAGVCRIGAMSVRAAVTVTLPLLTTLAQVSPDIRAAWESFAERVRIHENRHVTILEEGLTEMRRQLLQVGDHPDCDALDREIEKVWLLAGSQMEQRQNAFHAADRAGQGGSVVR